MIKGIPGKHSMKKDDYLMTMMQVPPKQRIAITPFDIRTQRDAFSVSLDGLKGWNMNVLVAESPQAREDRKRRKELKKLAKQGGTLAVGTSPAAIPVTPGPTAVSTPGAAPAAQPSQAHPRHGSQPPSKLSVSTPSQPPQQTSSQPSGITPAGVGTPRPVGTPVPPPGTTAPGRHTPIPTPAPTPGGQTAGAGDNRRGVKREREDSVTQLNGTTVSAQGPAPGVTVSTNGPAKTTGVVLNAKAGSGGVRPRPLKKQRMVC
ncbi:hypothetical protein BC629DRAFT_1544646 [Irpex lacteus]|nr:hypothetical protein BC629DRAFT_1544646 [Irpex lacteus]